MSSCVLLVQCLSCKFACHFVFSDYTNMSQFLNRILGIPVELQNAMFKYFTDTLDAIVSEAKRAGHYDLGILGEVSLHASIVWPLGCARRA